MTLIDAGLNVGTYFDINDWDCYGTLLRYDLCQPIPSAMIECLNKPCPFVPGKLIKETHFLFYLPEKLDGIPLTVNSARSLLNGQNLLRFYSEPNSWYVNHDFANFSVSGCWKLLYAGPLPNSKGLTFKLQKHLFRRGGYVVPFARTALVMIILRAKKYGEILSKDEWGRAYESYGEGLRVRIGVYDEGAICISSRWSGRGYPDTGIFAEKIF